MTAAKWRRAMNTGLPGALPRALPSTGGRTAVAAPKPALDPYSESSAPRWLKFLRRTLSPRHVLVLAFVLLLPIVVSPFVLYQVASQALIFGLIGLSLTFLAGYGGMVYICFTVNRAESFTNSSKCSAPSTEINVPSL